MAVIDRWTTPELVRGKVRRVRNDQWGVGKRWQVRWRDADGVQRKRRFTTEGAAAQWWGRVSQAPQERTRTRTVAEQWDLWIASKAGLSEGARRDYEAQWTLRVAPRFADERIGSLSHSDITAWVASVAATVSPDTTRRAFVVLSGIVRQAMRDRVIDADPTAGVALPRITERAMRIPTLAEVGRLADECAPHGLVVWTLALTGLRWGELAALEHRDIDRKRRRIRVSRAVSEVAGHRQVGPPKTGRHRDVPIPAWLLDQIPPGEGPVFVTSRGNPWRHSSWRRVWVAARARAGLPEVRVHDLRHTAASLAIQSGADVKAVQRMLGHATATMTLDRYAHLWDQGLDDVAARLDRMVSALHVPSRPAD